MTAEFRVPWLPDAGRPDLPEDADWDCLEPPQDQIRVRVYADEAVIEAMRADPRYEEIG